MKNTITTAALAAMVLTATAALAAPTPADKCEASKNKTVGAYYSCREKAEATAITKATTPDYSKCTAKFDDKWDDAETTGAGACPDTVMTAPMNAFIASQATEAASIVGGASIPSCAVDLSTACTDLAACEAVPVGQVHETGQTICYNAAGAVIACAGTGQDGELHKGITNSFTDNGDGTISDNLSGLMWEKLDDSNLGGLAGIHDWNNIYTLANAFVKVSDLNASSFAGHSDWRLPNRNELLTLANMGAVSPATFSAFNAACAPGCTVTTCSCTQSDFYWSSSTYQDLPTRAWLVYFYSGTTGADFKTYTFYVRGVRAGS